MGFERKAPSIKVEITVELYNSLVGIISKQSELNDEYISGMAEVLKNKIMTYAVPKVDKENIEYVDIRFFASEINSLTNLLILATGYKEENNFYKQLLDKREEFKNNR